MTETKPDKIAELVKQAASHWDKTSCTDTQIGVYVQSAGDDLMKAALKAATVLREQAAEIEDYKGRAITLTKGIERIARQLAEAQAEIARLRGAAEIAYSEMCFAVHDLAGRRLNSENAIDTRSKKLALAADKLHAALGGKE